MITLSIHLHVKVIGILLGNWVQSQKALETTLTWVHLVALASATALVALCAVLHFYGPSAVPPSMTTPQRTEPPLCARKAGRWHLPGMVLVMIVMGGSLLGTMITRAWLRS